MKYQDMPKLQLTGKIANNHLNIYYINQSHTPYTIIMLYVLINNHAILYPLTFLDNEALKVVKQAKQGDLIQAELSVSPIYTAHGFDCNLVVNKWFFAEKISSFTRNRTIKQNFPIVPDNYPITTKGTNKGHKEHCVKSDANQYLSQAEINPNSVEIIPPNQKDNSASSNAISSASTSTVHIKPHVMATKQKHIKDNLKGSAVNKQPYNWMDAMNKDLGMTFDEMK